MASKQAEYGRSQAILASKPVRWPATTCAKCNGPVYLCVEPGGERTWTEHQCSAKTTEQQHINACR